MAAAHVELVIVLLLSLWMLLSRGKGNREQALREISGNKRLGPDMAKWLEKNEKQLEHLHHMEAGK